MHESSQTDLPQRFVIFYLLRERKVFKMSSRY